MKPNKFKQTRLSLNLTQKDLAEKLGINTQSVSDIERGVINPSRRLITCLKLLVDKLDTNNES